MITESILLLILLLVLSAFFSASETAITSSGRGKILALMERYPYQRRFFEWLLRDIQRALTIVLISNNLVNIAASAVATSVAILLLGQRGLFVSVAAMTVLIVVFGEISRRAWPSSGRTPYWPFPCPCSGCWTSCSPPSCGSWSTWSAASG
jgi:Mg2+/Co2+ transporter CorB